MSFKFKDVEDFKECISDHYDKMIVHDKVSDTYYHMQKPNENYSNLFNITCRMSINNRFMYNRYKSGGLAFIKVGEMLLRKDFIE